MSRFRLRYKNTDLEMHRGEFLLGRSSSCNLALEDGMVSRRHARLWVDEESVRLEDLASRNGVSVNGRKIHEPTELKHGDRITVGTQDLTIVDLTLKAGAADEASDRVRCSACGASNPRDTARCARCRAPLGDRDTLSEGHTLDVELPRGHFGSDETTREAQAFSLVASIADKSLGMRRYEDAERILARHLDIILDKAVDGAHIEPELLDNAVAYALKLAEGKNGARWLTYVFRMHTARKTLMAETTIDRLHDLVRRSRYGDRAPIADYMQVVKKMGGELSATDRFLVRRLEALERVIAA